MGTTLELLRQPMKLLEDVRKAVDEANSFKHECRKLGLRVEELGKSLRSVFRRIAGGNGSFCERPTSRIMKDCTSTLEKCCDLVRKCKHTSIMSKVMGIKSATDFRWLSLSVDNARANLEWLLNVSTDDDMGMPGMPPIASPVPMLAVVWAMIAKIQGGNPKTREGAASYLTYLSEQHGHLIVDEGGIPLLLKLLNDGTPEAQILAATALGKLREYARQFANDGGIPAFMQVLTDGSMQLQAKVAWALAEMVSCDQDMQKDFGASNFVRPLVSLMLEFIDDSPTELTSGIARGRQRENQPSEVKYDMKRQATRALWMLVQNNVKNSWMITEAKAMLGFAKLIESEQGELQRDAVMAVVALAESAEEDKDLRKFAFKRNSPSARALTDQVLRIINDPLGDSSIQESCIKVVGCLARTFSEKENRVIPCLARKLRNTDYRYPAVTSEVIDALLKFVDDEHHLHLKNAQDIVEASALPYLVQLAVLDNRSVQIPAIALLCQLVLHMGHRSGLAFRETAALTVLKSVAASCSTLNLYVEFPMENIVHTAIKHLEFCEGQEVSHPQMCHTGLE